MTASSGAHHLIRTHANRNLDTEFCRLRQLGPSGGRAANDDYRLEGREGARGQNRGGIADGLLTSFGGPWRRRQCWDKSVFARRALPVS
jgi:hypothetical protein